MQFLALVWRWKEHLARICDEGPPNMKSQPAMLQITDLYFAYGAAFRLAIPAISVQPGEIVCIAGPNGGGKTTYLECLTGLLQPSRGQIAVDGTVIKPTIYHTKSLIGYVPDDENWFIKELCANEYFEVLMSVYWSAGVTINMKQRCADLAKALRFSSFNRPLQQLSHGNKKKVQIIAALMHNPKVLIVDEIRNGLDPLAVIAVEKLLKQHAESGACIVAATHDLWWAERLATTVLLLVDGKPILHMPVQRVTKQYGHVEKAFLELVL
jgi:ABC-2 type transport system ATP-binding protein